MRVFVTGATGFVGEAVVRALVAAGHQVSGLARSDASAARAQKLGALPVPGSMADATAWTKEAAGHDALVHAAVEYSPEGTAADSATVDAFAAAAKSGAVKSILYTSGVWVLGECPAGADETASTDAPYANVAWRPAHEKRVLALGGSKLDAAVIRPGWVYGGHGSLTAGYFESAVKEGASRIVGDGRNHAPLVHRDDLAALYLRILERGASGIFHAVDGAALTVAEIGRAASEAAGAKGAILSVPRDEAKKSLGAMADALCLDQVVRGPRAAALGWTPKLSSFTEGAPQAFAEWKTATAGR